MHSSLELIIIRCINTLTSLCKKFFILLEFLAEAKSKLNKFLHSEVNILIQRIKVQDKDGQNNNMNDNRWPNKIYQWTPHGGNHEIPKGRTS